MAAVFEKPPAYITYEDYLVLERASAYKHEYLAGVVYAVQGDGTQAMAGGSQTHARLIRNTLTALDLRLRDSACEALASDMGLRIEAANALFYPDVVVHCSRNEDPDATYALREARVVVEVLSQHTQRFDGGSKLAAYRLLAGLRQVVLVSSVEQAVWSCGRDSDDGPWTALSALGKADELRLPSLDIALSWLDMYRGTGLQPRLPPP